MPGIGLEMSTISQHFELSDKNGSGKITTSDLATAMRSLGQYLTKAELQVVLV